MGHDFEAPKVIRFSSFSSLMWLFLSLQFLWKWRSRCPWNLELLVDDREGKTCLENLSLFLIKKCKVGSLSRVTAKLWSQKHLVKDNMRWLHEGLRRVFKCNYAQRTCSLRCHSSLHSEILWHRCWWLYPSAMGETEREETNTALAFA